MKTHTLCSLLTLTLLTPVFGAADNWTAEFDAAKKKETAAKTEAGKPVAQKKPMAKQEAKPAPKKARHPQSQARKGLGGLNDRQLKEKMAATRKEVADNQKLHERSHHDWKELKTAAQAIEDKIAIHRKEIAELEDWAGKTTKKIKELEDVHAATEKTEGALKAVLVQQEKELARRAEIRKLEEQAAKLKAQAEALEKRAAELK